MIEDAEFAETLRRWRAADRRARLVKGLMALGLLTVGLGALAMIFRP